MKAECPRDPSHQRFLAPALIRKRWILDPAGNYCGELRDEVIHQESRWGDEWRCQQCGAVAIKQEG
jgi:hypothetical protein